MSKSKHIEPGTAFSAGLMSPFLQSEKSSRLAARVLSALAPSKIPKTEDEVKLFAEMISLVVQQPENSQFQTNFAVHVWPHAAGLHNDAKYAQARALPTEIRIGKYTFTQFKSFKDAIVGRLPLFFMGSLSRGNPIVLSISTLAVDKPVAYMSVFLIPNLALPLEPFLCLLNGLLIGPDKSDADEIEKAAHKVVALIEDIFKH